MINLRLNGSTCIIKCLTQEIFDAPSLVGSFLTVKHSGFLKNGTLRYPFYWRLSEKQFQPLVITHFKQMNEMKYILRNIHLIGEMIVIEEIWLI